LPTGGSVAYFSSVSVLCLGEAIIDLFCERPVTSLGEADSFVPHCGGAVANAAVTAARCGAEVSLAGGVGDDAWGDWIEERLHSYGVGLRWFARLPHFPTPLAFVLVNQAAEPDFIVYGEAIEAGILSLEDNLEDAVAAHDALLFGSNTLVGERERALTLRARELALAAGKRVLFDPNLRMRRWKDAREPLDMTAAALEGATLLKVNRSEAELLTGQADPADAAERLVEMGAQLVAVTLGPEGALLRGAATADAPGVPANAIDTTGAGDVVTGVLTAALSSSEFSAQAAADALGPAVAAAARATEGWGALDSLPDDMVIG
jgi:sugar/nucleoside kinase (ribokinase family)